MSEAANQAGTASAEARALLAWYALMGVDEAIGELPSDWAGHAAFAAAAGQDGVAAPSAGPRASRLPPKAAGAPSHAPAPVRAPAPGHVAPPPMPSADEPPPWEPPGEPPSDYSRGDYPGGPAVAMDEFDAPAPRRPEPGPRQPTTQPAATFGLARSNDGAVQAAREAARTAGDLDALRAILETFDGCALKATAKNLCFYRGAPKARLMLIGEAPGRDEDLAGKPFVGPAGQLLDRMLAAIGLGEGDVHITNVVYWRPPGNRTPTPQETQICQPFLLRQIELVGPSAILCLGGAAAKQVLDTPEGIMRLRGKWRGIDSAGGRIATMATLHPAYLLRTPVAKRMAWRDLMLVKVALDGAG